VDGLIIGSEETLSGNGEVNGNVTNGGLPSLGNSPALNFTGDLVLGRAGTLLIEIGGSEAAVAPAT
jgi:hypothetical protein